MLRAVFQETFRVLMVQVCAVIGFLFFESKEKQPEFCSALVVFLNISIYLFLLLEHMHVKPPHYFL